MTPSMTQKQQILDLAVLALITPSGPVEAAQSEGAARERARYRLPGDQDAGNMGLSGIPSAGRTSR